MSVQWYLVISLIVLSAVILIARIAKPAINQSGNEINPPQSWKQATGQSTQVLKVATYNIQTGKNLFGERNITRSANVITDADIVGIQEVYAPGWLNRLGLGISQTEHLAKTGDFGWLFCATRHRWFREHRGNALLSKFPIKTWRIEMLPDLSRKSFRNMTIAELSWQGETIVIINTHLHTKNGRERQLQIVLDELLKYPRVLLIGDFNSHFQDPILHKFLAENDVVDTISKAAIGDKDEQRIDWILSKGFKVVDGKTQDKGVSDHPYYQVNLLLL